MFGLLLLAVLAAALIGGLWVRGQWTGAGPAAAETDVSIPQGATLGSSARALAKAGAIPSASRFVRLARFFGSAEPVKAGEYVIPAHASAAEVLRIIQGGKTRQRLVTIPEGMPAVLVRARLMAEPLLTGDVPVPPEGSVLPDSYSFEKGDTRAAILKRMQDAMAKELAADWKARKPATVAKSPEQAIILASIVEKETALPAERPLVAAVYSNRLRTGMKLQADPTVIYPVTQGRPLGRRIRRSELDAQNGYNTYATAGLPKGPIANPGRDSIKAVLNPASSSALYFVADGKGGHVFATTLAEHNANVAKWYAIRRARGEM